MYTVYNIYIYTYYIYTVYICIYILDTYIYWENMGKSSFKPGNLEYPASDKHSSNGLENLL